MSRRFPGKKQDLNADFIYKNLLQVKQSKGMERGIKEESLGGASSMVIQSVHLSIQRATTPVTSWDLVTRWHNTELAE